MRAGIVADPKDYRHCGYAEAIVGKKAAREGLARALTKGRGGRSWKEIHVRYRRLLYGIGRLPAGIDSSARSAELAMAEVLRCRVRHFAEGLAIGSEGFLESVFEENRAGFRRIQSGAGVPLPGDRPDELRALKPLSSTP